MSNERGPNKKYSHYISLSPHMCIYTRIYKEPYVCLYISTLLRILQTIRHDGIGTPWEACRH
jgi:hypothetical protein